MTTIIKRFWVVSLFAAALTFSHTGLAGGHAKSKAEKADIVDVAAGNEDFSTLVKAVKAAGLVDTLKGDGPLTVFAPTNDAFAKLPEGTLEMLLKPENKDKLVSVLTYHVVPGKVLAKEINDKSKVKTVQGQKIKVRADKSGVAINDARVVKADILTSNGVIHVIDKVILPKS